MAIISQFNSLVRGEVFPSDEIAIRVPQVDEWRRRGTTVKWLRDLLPGDIQNTRILAFAYDANAINHRYRVFN